MTVLPSPHRASMASFGMGLNVVVMGATGGIGNKLAELLEECAAVERVFRLSRTRQMAAHVKTTCLPLDLEEEDTIAAAAAVIRDAAGPLHLVLVATGVLHQPGLRPEKTWRNLSAAAMATAFRINTIGPALAAKHFLPLLARERKTAFAALSARVGSIGDNRLGGWHAYRASKAALNMMIRTLSIELARSHPLALCVGLHPGTVDTALSQPFQSAVPDGRLFDADRAARQLLAVVDRLPAHGSGNTYAWDGSVIPF